MFVFQEVLRTRMKLKTIFFKKCRGCITECEPYSSLLFNLTVGLEEEK